MKLCALLPMLDKATPYNVTYRPSKTGESKVMLGARLRQRGQHYYFVNFGSGRSSIGSGTFIEKIAAQPRATATTTAQV